MPDHPLLQSLFDEAESVPLSVSELNAQVRGELERRFSSVWVEGEIVNFTAARSGHWYFTLHDEDSQIKAACFRGSNYRIRFQPFDGLQVRVRGRITVYEPKGEYQLMVESLEPVGEGALRVAFEQIKAKLDAEGLFAEELKRALPLLPRKVGVVTSPTGAAFFDILNVISRRTRSVSVVLIPTRVQGETAGEEIRNAIKIANEYNRLAAAKDRFDVLIVGRGGGSAEDLWAFNEERLARAIRASEIPVISAVGHEIDFTIADFVADLRAATPSAAAEIVAARESDIEAFIDGRLQDLEQLINYKMLKSTSAMQELAMSPVFIEFPNKIGNWLREVESHSLRLQNAFVERLNKRRFQLETISAQLSPLKLASNVSRNRTRLAVLSERNTSGARNVLNAKQKSLKVCMATLDALSPLKVLGRGFSITETESGQIVRNTEQISVGDSVKIRLAEGNLKARVTDKEQPGK
jgi:exodeoxyribonuclease VII, large subunit